MELSALSPHFPCARVLPTSCDRPVTGDHSVIDRLPLHHPIVRARAYRRVLAGLVTLSGWTLRIIRHRALRRIAGEVHGTRYLPPPRIDSRKRTDPQSGSSLQQQEVTGDHSITQ